jgi:hypothetical protein
VGRVVDLLVEHGPALPFPYSSGIVGSRHRHMRELRIQHHGRPYRVLYAFDPRRAAILLLPEFTCVDTAARVLSRGFPTRARRQPRLSRGRRLRAAWGYASPRHPPQRSFGINTSELWFSSPW